MTAEIAFRNLIEGNNRFRRGESLHRTIKEKTLQDMAEKQQPYAVILTCSDSRCAPEVIFDTTVNELFVIRNVGNIVTDSEIAAIEYAVCHLDVQLVLVMGHTVLFPPASPKQRTRSGRAVQSRVYGDLSVTGGRKEYVFHRA